MSHPTHPHAPLAVDRALPMALAPEQRSARESWCSSHQTAVCACWRVSPRSLRSNDCHGSTRASSGSRASIQRAERMQKPHCPSYTRSTLPVCQCSDGPVRRVGQCSDGPVRRVGQCAGGRVFWWACAPGRPVLGWACTSGRPVRRRASVLVGLCTGSASARVCECDGAAVRRVRRGGPVALEVMSKRTSKRRAKARRSKANHGRKPNAGRNS